MVCAAIIHAWNVVLCGWSCYLIKLNMHLTMDMSLSTSLSQFSNCKLNIILCLCACILYKAYDIRVLDGKITSAVYKSLTITGSLIRQYHARSTKPGFSESSKNHYDVNQNLIHTCKNITAI